MTLYGPPPDHALVAEADLPAAKTSRRRLPKPLVNLAEVELAERRAEVLVVEDPLVDLVVGVHAGDDCLEELAVEDELEVIDGVVLRLGRKLAVLDPAFLELVEEQLVHIRQVRAEAIVEQLDDAGEVLQVEFLLATLPLAEERPDLADLGGQRQRAA